LLVPGEAFRSAAPSLGVDVLITGTIEKRGNTYLLQIIPIRVSDAKSSKPLQLNVEATEFLDSFITPFPQDIRRAVQGKAELTVLDRQLLKDYLRKEWITLGDFHSNEASLQVGRDLGATGALPEAYSKKMARSL